MNKLALVGCLVSAIAFAQADKAAAPPAMGEQKDMMMGWTPRPVTKEDRKGIQATIDAQHKAWMAGDIATAMSNMDFPIFMMTDDKEGKVMTMMTDADSYKKMMEPMMKGMMENKEMMAAMQKMPKPKMDMFFLTDTMALVTSKGQMPMPGGKKTEMRNAMIMTKQGDKWMVKGEMEGGWGDASKHMMQMEKGKDMKSAGTTGPTKGGMK